MTISEAEKEFIKKIQLTELFIGPDEPTSMLKYVMEKKTWPGRKSNGCHHFTLLEAATAMAGATGLTGASLMPKAQTTAASES